jgi:hypothetical protein
MKIFRTKKDPMNEERLHSGVNKNLEEEEIENFPWRVGLGFPY